MVNSILFYNLQNIQNININYPDIYYTPEYGLACQYSDNAIWELCIYKDLMFCYLKKIDENKIITPYGYSGFYYKEQSTFNEFIPKFNNYLKSINITEQIIRQNPYLNINITNYQIIKKKIILGIKIDNIDDYFKNIFNSKTRNIINKANKLQLTIHFFHKSKINKIDDFIKMYEKSMDNINSNKYYYFNYKYFETIFKMNNCFLSIIKNSDNKDIGMGLFFIYNNYLHYHLSCNDKSNNCIHNFMLYKTLEKYGLNKIFILGGGLEDNDNLFKFKKKISNIEFKYNIYKNKLTP